MPTTTLFFTLGVIPQALPLLAMRLGRRYYLVRNGAWLLAPLFYVAITLLIIDGFWPALLAAAAGVPFHLMFAIGLQGAHRGNLAPDPAPDPAADRDSTETNGDRDADDSSGQGP